MFRKTSVNSEEFIFYFDLTTDFLKKKSLIKSISSFIKDKEKFNTLTSYGILLFQEDDNPITVYDEKDFKVLSDVIDEKWEIRETEKSLFENGLFEILAYIFRKSREARKNYRVIIISDTPSLLSEDYHNALYDLLIKAKKFDAFIDIIRIGDQKFYADDVKLKVVSSETHGGVFYCTEAKFFLNILLSLIQSKSEFIVVQPEEGDQIFEEDKIFYERLAVDLISLDSEDEEKCDLCERELCPICDAHSDEVHKCFNCNAKYHACCAANYAIANPIGFNHLFRCVQCDTLLKLDEEYVEMIYREEHEEEFKAKLMELEITDEILEEEHIEEGHIEEGHIEEGHIEEGHIEEEQIEEQSFKEEEEELVIGKEIFSSEKFGTPPKLVRPPPKLIKPQPELDGPQPELVEPQPELVEPQPKLISTKKVKVGGYFGREITVKTNDLNNDLVPPATETVVRDSEGTTQVKEKVSITLLKPPRRSTIKFCQICGFTLKATSLCPKCGFKN